MINLGDSFHLRELEQTTLIECHDSWVMGLWEKPHVVQYPQETRLFGVHFKPNGAYPFLQMPLTLLHNQIVPLDTIWGSLASDIQEQLATAPTVQAGFALLEQFLLAQLTETPHGLDVVQYAISRIEQRQGGVSIKALSDEIGISQMHLGTWFKRMVGVSPKRLAQFYRFAHVLHTINAAQLVDWAGIAQQANFYDQAHFNKNFLDFTGYTPSEYLKRSRHLSSAHTDYTPTIGLLPIV